MDSIHTDDELYCLMKVDYPHRIGEIGALRIRAWRNEPGVDPRFFAQSTWIEPLDQTAHHWVVTHNDEVVAAARMTFHSTIDDVPYMQLVPTEHRQALRHRSLASINRLVVDPRFRGRGLARQLDLVRLDLARQLGAEVVVAQPQLSRLNSLSRLGFDHLCGLNSTPEMPERPLFFMQLALTA